MRSAIACLTMLATVLHLAVGCCLHASHVAGAAACHPDDHGACVAEACGHEHDHDRSHEHGTLLAGDAADGHDPQRPVIVEPPAHECEGCDCVATTEARPGSPWPSSPLRHAGCPLASIAMSQADRGPCAMAASPVLADLQPPLFERLLV